MLVSHDRELLNRLPQTTLRLRGGTLSVLAVRPTKPSAPGRASGPPPWPSTRRREPRSKKTARLTAARHTASASESSRRTSRRMRSRHDSDAREHRREEPGRLGRGSRQSPGRGAAGRAGARAAGRAEHRARSHTVAPHPHPAFAQPFAGRVSPGGRDHRGAWPGRAARGQPGRSARRSSAHRGSQRAGKSTLRARCFPRDTRRRWPRDKSCTCRKSSRRARPPSTCEPCAASIAAVAERSQFPWSPR